MGLFDTVDFNCPNCGGTIDIQSKAQPDSFNSYPASITPIVIAADILGEEVRCEHCNRLWVVSGPPLPKAVSLELIELLKRKKR